MTAVRSVPLSHDQSDQDAQSIADCVSLRIQSYFDDLNGQSPCQDLYQTIVSQVEKPLIQQVLTYANGNKVKAADILGISRNTLLKKMKVHKL